jgi:hypothetical protein
MLPNGPGTRAMTWPVVVGYTFNVRLFHSLSSTGLTAPIPVGTRVTPRPPDRSERALLTHSAPTSGV